MGSPLRLGGSQYSDSPCCAKKNYSADGLGYTAKINSPGFARNLGAFQRYAADHYRDGGREYQSPNWPGIFMCIGLRSHIGSMLASLGGAGLRWFFYGLGLAKNSAPLRAAACEAFDFLGVKNWTLPKMSSLPVDQDVATPDFHGQGIGDSYPRRLGDRQGLLAAGTEELSFSERVYENWYDP